MQVVAGAIARAFGPVYFSVNFGLMFTSGLIFYSILILVSQVDVFYDTIGDTGMFLCAGALSAIATLLTMFVPSDILEERRKKKEVLSLQRK